MLTKIPTTTFEPGQEAIAPAPAQTVCVVKPPAGTTNPTGSWQRVCNIVHFPLNTSIPTQSGGSYTLLSITATHAVYQVCASQWVPNDG